MSLQLAFAEDEAAGWRPPSDKAVRDRLLLPMGVDVAWLILNWEDWLSVQLSRLMRSILSVSIRSLRSSSLQSPALDPNPENKRLRVR
jgi:hypothetical protein